MVYLFQRSLFAEVGAGFETFRAHTFQVRAFGMNKTSIYHSCLLRMVVLWCLRRLERLSELYYCLIEYTLAFDSALFAVVNWL